MSTVERLVDLLDLTDRGGGVFAGPNGHRRGVGDSVFGGQLIAQALRAASLTVPVDRCPSSVHAAFVRAAKRSAPVEYRVTTVRDGGSVSVRQVVAEQGGATVLHAFAGFKEPEDGADLDALPAETFAPPDECEVVGWDDLLDTRAIRFHSPKPRVYMCDTFWVRAAHPFPDDPVLQACALGYLSDLGSGFASLDDPEIPAGGPSLDHALWFHRPVRVDGWLLVDNRALMVGDARGTYLGSIRDEDGALGAVLGQEVMLRMPSPYARRSVRPAR